MPSLNTKWSSLVVASGLSALLSACGATPKAAVSAPKVVNGQDATASDPVTKSTVALTSLLGQEFCTGTLIDRRHIVSAAHCAAGARNGFLAVFGTVAIAGVTETDHAVLGSTFKANTAFDPAAATRGIGSPVNDVSLVTLAADAPSDAEPVAFLSRNDRLNNGDEITVAGFGLTSAGAFGSNVLLRQTKSQIIELSDSGKEFVLGNSNGRACNGDSGGPAYVERDGKLVLAGIVSRGEAGCNGKVIYTDVRYFLDWINRA